MILNTWLYSPKWLKSRHPLHFSFLHYIQQHLLPIERVLFSNEEKLNLLVTQFLEKGRRVSGDQKISLTNMDLTNFT